MKKGQKQKWHLVFVLQPAVIEAVGSPSSEDSLANELDSASQHHIATALNCVRKRLCFIFFLLYIQFYLLIYLGRTGSLLLRGLLSSCDVQDSLVEGRLQGSVVVAPRPQSTGSTVVALRFSYSLTCGIFPDPGLNPCLLHWQADSLPLKHQESPVPYFLFTFCAFVSQMCLQMIASALYAFQLRKDFIGTVYFWVEAKPV